MPGGMPDGFPGSQKVPNAGETTGPTIEEVD